MQLSLDTGKKLHKLEGFEGMNRLQLLEIAQKVYNHCDSVEEQNKKLTWAIVTAIEEIDKRDPRAWKTQDPKKGKARKIPIVFIICKKQTRRMNVQIRRGKKGELTFI